MLVNDVMSTNVVTIASHTSLADARRISGGKLLIGVSVRDVLAAREASAGGADYIGVGPVFKSPTKPEHVPLAPGTVAEIRQEISLPIVAIGGINEANVAAALQLGVDGVAVISALRQCHNLGEAVARLRRAIEDVKKG